jgi:hypothetical protein
MESSNSRDVELPFTYTPSNASSQPTSTPHYIIAAQEITADRESQLGSARRTGSVFKGFWNNSVVAVKVLSSETPVDVGRSSLSTRARTSSNGPVKL